MKNRALVEFGIRYPKVVISLSVLITIFFLLAFPSIQRDTDPVHMLPQDNPAIKLYEKTKEQFSINDLVVVGIQSKKGDSLFNAKQLKRIHDLTKDILTIREDDTPSTGIMMKVMAALRIDREVKSEESHNRIFIEEDVVSLSTVDDIILNENKELLLRPLMGDAPKTDEQATGILASINSNPLFKDKLAAKDGKLVGVYLPLYNGKKDQSYYLSQEIEKRVKKHLTSEEQYFIAGLPVAENTFGNEMFTQMRVYAPLAGLVIFLLLYYFFRSFKLILAPMIVAIMTVTWSMGALIYSGQKIHIMTSMIPIFLMPIAVLDAVHILSTLHDKMAGFNSRIEAIRGVMGELYKPMLFTTVTTFIGFISLSTTGIPPVIFFGITVGGGVLVAWFLSMVFIPAYTVILSDKSFKNFGADHSDRKSWVLKVIPLFKKVADGNQKLVILVTLIIMGVSIIGVNSIIVNDNPVRWFKKDHNLRKADGIMNQKLAGTYQANLIFDIPLKSETLKVTNSVTNTDDEFGDDNSEDDFSTTETKQLPSVRDPKVIRYISKVSDFLTNFRDEDGNQIVGAVTSIVDILKKSDKSLLMMSLYQKPVKRFLNTCFFLNLEIAKKEGICGNSLPL